VPRGGLDMLLLLLLLWASGGDAVSADMVAVLSAVCCVCVKGVVRLAGGYEKFASSRL
jgi:hypothetical protein